MSDLNVELTNGGTNRVSLGDPDIRNLLAVPTGRIALSDAYGKFKFTLPVGGTGGEWVPTSDATHWGSFMNQYAIWNQNTTVPTVETFESPIYFPVTGTYTIEYAADDLIGFAFDTGYIAYNESQSTGADFSTSRVITQSFTSGYHTIYVSVANNTSPWPGSWGIAMTVKDSSNNIIWNTRNTNFQGGYFENTESLVQHGGYATFGTTWTIQLNGVNLDGVDNILGFTTPTDASFPWPHQSGEVDIHNPSKYAQIGSYTVAMDSDVPSGLPAGSQSMVLSLGTPTPMIFAGTQYVPPGAYGTTRGPYLISEEFVTVAAGKTVKFWYKAAGIVDAYDIYAYIIDIYNGTKITILNESGQTTSSGTSWQQVSTVVPSAGVYKFVFVNGSWDYTGGLYTGARMLIAGITVEQ
jgi:hypothetical protein